MSTTISQRENNEPLQLSDVDLLAQVRQRIKAALDARVTELSVQQFAERIGQKSASWRSEILVHEHKPWPDKITLLVRAARVLGVSVGFLVGDHARPHDPLLDALLQAWAELTVAERRHLVRIAHSSLEARGIAATGESSAEPPSVAGSSTPHTRPKAIAPRPRKAR